MCAPWRARIAVLGLLVPLITGCGSSSYTKHDFVARADAICAGALRQTRSIPAGTSLESYLTDLLPILQSEATQLRNLPPPPEGSQQRAILSRYFAALARTVADYRRLAAAVKGRNQQAMNAAEAALAASPAESLAVSYGLPSCGPPNATVR